MTFEFFLHVHLSVLRHIICHYICPHLHTGARVEIDPNLEIGGRDEVLSV